MPRSKKALLADGDGMIHAIRFSGGRLEYCNRTILTPRYLQEKEYGRAIYPKMGEFPGVQMVGSDQANFNTFKFLTIEMAKSLGAKEYDDWTTNGTYNTGIVHHAKRTYALIEVSLPFGLRISHAEGFDVQSVGVDDFGGQMKHGITAHPKVDPRTGELLTFGYGQQENKFDYSRFDKDRKLQTHISMKFLSHRMIHDFAVTEKYVIVPDMPFELCAMGAVCLNRPMFRFNPKAGTRYGILPRDAKSAKEIVWFDFDEADGHYCGHFSNAYETVENGQDVVVIHGAALKQYKSMFELREEHPFIQNKEETMALTEIKLNLTTGNYSMEPLFHDHHVDFLMVNPAYIGQKNRFIWCAIVNEEELSRKGNESSFFNGFIKYDTQEKRIVHLVKYGGEKQAGEVQFAPRINSQAEDDGYLMTFVFDPETDKTEFCMWDAATCDLVMKAETRERVPHGFHGTYVEADDLDIPENDSI